MRLSLVQHDIVWEDRDATLARLEDPVARAADGGARLVALTEMFATGFSMRTQHTVESVDGPTVTWLHEQASRHDCWLAGSVPIRGAAPDADTDAGATTDAGAGAGAGPLPTNSLFLIGPQGQRYRYDKIYPFSFAGEHERFRAGTAGVVVEIEGLRIGLSVCYDLRFAELYWDRAPGVDLELVVANWPAARRHHWRSLVMGRAIENQTYVAAVNRVGQGGSLDYLGDSRIVDPVGEVLAGAAVGETILTAEVDAQVVAATRAAFPFQADRRGARASVATPVDEV